MTFHAPVTKPYGVAPSPYMAQGAGKGMWKGLAFIAPFQTPKGAGTSTLLDQFGHPLAGSNLTAGSTLQWRGTPYGLGVGISGASNLLYQDDFAVLSTSDGVYTGDFSMVCLANPKAEARVSCLLGQSVAGAQPRTFLIPNPGNVSGDFSFFTGETGPGWSNIIVSGITDGRYHMFGGRKRGTDCTLWVDGTIRGSGTTSQGCGTSAGGIAIGHQAETASDLRIATDCNIVFCAAWNRALTNFEMLLLGIDPFYMFRPAPVRKVINTVAAGGTAVPVFMHHYMQQRAA